MHENAFRQLMKREEKSPSGWRRPTPTADPLALVEN
jgi:hypothetical protein